MRLGKPWRTVLSDRLIDHNVVVAAGTLSAGVLGIVFQSVISHRFKPTDYGAIFAAMTMLGIVAVPAGALTLVMAREASRDKASSRGGRSAAMLRNGNRWLLAAGVIFALLIAYFSPQLGAFLNAPRSVLVVTALGIPFTLALPVLIGELQGEQRFWAFSLLSCGQAGLRLVAAFALGWLLGPVGVLAGISLATGITYFLTRVLVHQKASSAESQPEWAGALRYLAVVLPGTVGLALLLSADVLLVKHFFNEQLAGQYAAIAALGRAIFWGATGIAWVLFPKLVFQDTRGSGDAHLVIGSLLLVLLGGLVGMAILMTWSTQIVTLFAGVKYLQAATYLPWYAVGMTLLGAAYVLVVVYQSRGDASFLLVLIPVTVFEPAIILAFHQQLLQVVQVMDLSMLLLVIGLSALYALGSEGRRRQRGDRSVSSSDDRLTTGLVAESVSSVSTRHNLR